MENLKAGKLFLIVGPSGSGKGTVIAELKGVFTAFVYPISYTTRKIREGEKPDDVYHFIAREEFEKMIKEDDFLEYAIVHSNEYYGTSKKDIMEALKAGKTVIREVDMQGFNSIKNIIPKEQLVSIFMKVSDLDDLKQRILRRGQMSDEELKRRMDSAIKEMAKASQCDYQVENRWGEIKQCVDYVEQIIRAELE
ncbi:MAG: guanylate kinase [Candidatus Gracilibacteria bacterium]|jgi:guanylate kinase